MARTRTTRRIFTVATVVAAVAAGLLIVTALHEPAHADVTLDRALLVSTRDELRLCVALSPTLEKQRAGAGIHDQLAGSLARVRNHPDWDAAYGAAEIADRDAVEASCPDAKLPDRYEPKITVAGPGVTEEPSPYRTWIYVLDEATADRLLGAGVQSGTAAAELMRVGKDELVTVTSALLVRQSRLDDAEFVTELTRAVGLRVPDAAPEAPSTK